MLHIRCSEKCSAFLSTQYNCLLFKMVIFWSHGFRLHLTFSINWWLTSIRDSTLTDYKLILFRVLTTTKRYDFTGNLDENIRTDQRVYFHVGGPAQWNIPNTESGEYPFNTWTQLSHRFDFGKIQLSVTIYNKIYQKFYSPLSGIIF